MTITRVAIIGLGLLGGSIGLAIKARGLPIAILRCESGPRSADWQARFATLPKPLLRARIW